MACTKTAKVPTARPKLTMSQRIARHDKSRALMDAINNARIAYMQEVLTISKKHGWSTQWVHHQLYFGRSARKKSRRPNAWNAFVHQRLNDINENLLKGERWRLPEFIDAYKGTLLSHYSKLTPTQKTGYQDHVMQLHAKKQQIIRDNPKSIQRDMQASFVAMDQEWTSLCSHLGAEGFYIAVRGGVEDLSGPKLFFTEKAEKFARTVLDLEPCCMALKLESFVVSGLDSCAALMREPSHGLNKLVSKCRSIIQEGLAIVLCEKYKHKNKSKSKRMNYENYEHDIVEHHGVALVGWPDNILPVQNPSRIGSREALQPLLGALSTETCHWVKLTDDQLKKCIEGNHACQSKGEVVYKP